MEFAKRMDRFGEGIFSVLLGYDPLSPQMVVGGIIILISITMTEIKLPFGKKEKPILVEKRED